MRDYLDGNLISALVGYNAGPGNSDMWREAAGADDALFVEQLTINEPRIYIHTIVSEPLSLHAPLWFGTVTPKRIA